MCLTGRLPFSNYCVSSLAAGFRFHLYSMSTVSPCPGILILELDVVQTRSFLDWSHTGAFDFSRLCLYQHWCWGQGGSSLNLIQALESIVILETLSVPPQCQHGCMWVYDLRFWHDDAWRESRALLVEEWKFMLDMPKLCEHLVKGLSGTLTGSFFLAPQQFFSFWTVCVSFDRGHF